MYLGSVQEVPIHDRCLDGMGKVDVAFQELQQSTVGSRGLAGPFRDVAVPITEIGSLASCGLGSHYSAACGLLSGRQYCVKELGYPSRDNPHVPAHGRMRGYDRDLIRGGHYGQRSCKPRSKAEHMAAPTKPCDVKIVLANSEPSTHGTFGRADRGRKCALWRAKRKEPIRILPLIMEYYRR